MKKMLCLKKKEFKKGNKGKKRQQKYAFFLCFFEASFIKDMEDFKNFKCVAHHVQRYSFQYKKLTKSIVLV